MTLAIAVLSLTRDRLDYTQHCFDSLYDYAGIPFDHFVFDNGSEDGTLDYLKQHSPEGLIVSDVNVGINSAMNQLLELANEVDDYDVIVKFDNDCELTQPNTLRDVATLALEGGCVLSPRILGLRQPPLSIRELAIGDETIIDIPQIGGIFMAVPAWIYNEFSYDETKMIYDDVDLCSWLRRRGGTCGYVKRLEAWHYETTDGQHERYPDYFERKYEEMAVWIVTDDPVAQAYPIPGVGQVPAELDRACALYRKKRPKRILEIGTWYGGTLRKWLQSAQPNATVVAVDISHPDPGAYENWRNKDTDLVVLTGDSQDAEIIGQIVRYGLYDWIFIDGDHLEPGVDADVGLALSVAAPGATLLLHDIDPGGSQTTGPRAVFARLQLQDRRTESIIEKSEGTGYPEGAAHGIGVVYL